MCVEMKTERKFLILFGEDSRRENPMDTTVNGEVARHAIGNYRPKYVCVCVLHDVRAATSRSIIHMVIG